MNDFEIHQPCINLTPVQSLRRLLSISHTCACVAVFIFRRRPKTCSWPSPETSWAGRGSCLDTSATSACPSPTSRGPWMSLTLPSRVWRSTWNAGFVWCKWDAMNFNVILWAPLPTERVQPLQAGGGIEGSDCRGSSQQLAWCNAVVCGSKIDLICPCDIFFIFYFSVISCVSIEPLELRKT